MTGLRRTHAPRDRHAKRTPGGLFALHCLVLEGVHQRTGGEPVFVPADAASDRFKAVSFSDPMPCLGQLAPLAFAIRGPVSRD